MLIPTYLGFVEGKKVFYVKTERVIWTLSKISKFKTLELAKQLITAYEDEPNFVLNVSEFTKMCVDDKMDGYLFNKSGKWEKVNDVTHSETVRKAELEAHWKSRAEYHRKLIKEYSQLYFNELF